MQVLSHYHLKSGPSSHLPVHQHIVTFLSLPGPESDTQGVCTLCFEEEGEKPLVYIGSGTSVDLELWDAAQNYHSPDSSSSLPKFVARSFKEGYSLSNIGVLASTPTSPDSIVPRARGLFLGVEANLSILLYAVFLVYTDRYIEHDPLWPP